MPCSALEKAKQAEKTWDACQKELAEQAKMDAKAQQQAKEARQSWERATAEVLYGRRHSRSQEVNLMTLATRAVRTWPSRTVVIVVGTVLHKTKSSVLSCGKTSMPGQINTQVKQNQKLMRLDAALETDIDTSLSFWISSQ